MVRKMRRVGISNWYLYVGIFLACTGWLTIAGIIMIVFWFYHHFMDSGIKVRNVSAVDDYEKQSLIDKCDQALERVDEYEKKYLKHVPPKNYVSETKLEGWK
tara:strand:- start:82 stop:387 length:306 start_codon:yes stop_codon:yes gene_type:complete